MSGVLAAEFLKQSRQRALLFWGFFALPLFTTFFAFAIEAAAPSAGGMPLDVHVHPLRSAMRAAGIAGNPVAQLFFAIGAAGIFGVEYRYAGWRHIVPRASRASLLSAKLAVFAALAGASLCLVVGGDLLASLFPVATRGMSMADAGPATAAGLGLAFLVSLAELLALGGSVALITVLTRSTLAAILVPFLISFGAAGAEALFVISPDWLALIPLPTTAADAVRSWIWAQPEDPGPSAGAALAAAALLAVWGPLAFAGAILAFRRQDLSQE